MWDAIVVILMCLTIRTYIASYINKYAKSSYYVMRRNIIKYICVIVHVFLIFRLIILPFVDENVCSS